MMKIGEKVSTLDQPIDHLVSCHRRIEERLDTLERAGASLESNHDAIRKSLDFLESSGGWHTKDEEESVFPRLLSLDAGELSYLHELERQHDEAETALQDLKTAFD